MLNKHCIKSQRNFSIEFHQNEGIYISRWSNE